MGNEEKPDQERWRMRLLPPGTRRRFFAPGQICDLAERQRAAAALRESEARLRLFIEHAPAALAMFDRQMCYLTASRRWRNDYGLDERAILGRSHYEVFPDIPERWKEIHHRGLAGEVIRAEEDRFDRADGSTQWLRWEVRPWYDAAGAVGGLLIFSEDITHRKKMEEALRRSEERLRQGVKVARIGIFEHDHRTGAVHLSQEMRDIYGWSPDEAVTLAKIFERVHPEEREQMIAAVRRAHDPAGDGTYSVEHRLVRTDGEVRRVSVRSKTYFTGEGENCRPLRTIGAAIDITEHSRLEQELRSAKEAAEEASRVKSEFLARVSHELRTPLTVIMTALEIMIEFSPPDVNAQLLEMADSSAHRLLGIVDDLLDITRIETGEIKFEQRPFDLEECVRRTADAFAGPARAKGLLFQWEVMPSAPRRVSGDPRRVGQVLSNLIGNAVKFTDRGEVAVTVEAGEEGVVFAVRDTGIGLAAENLEQVFDPFTQVDSSLTRRHGGTGLGLAIAKELVERMGGTIRVASRPEHGSTFTFTLPLRPLAPVPPAAEETPATSDIL